MRQLDIENIGRIGQMFVSGDMLREVLVDDYTWDEDETNYNIPVFTALKGVLMKIERLNPDLDIVGALWLWYRANRLMAIPAVAGKAPPGAGRMIRPADSALIQALKGGENTALDLVDGRRTHYFPLRDSTDAVVGALELTCGGKSYPYVYRYDAVVPHKGESE